MFCQMKWNEIKVRCVFDGLNLNRSKKVERVRRIYDQFNICHTQTNHSQTIIIIKTIVVMWSLLYSTVLHTVSVQCANCPFEFNQLFTLIQPLFFLFLSSFIQFQFQYGFIQTDEKLNKIRCEAVWEKKKWEGVIQIYVTTALKIKIKKID